MRGGRFAGCAGWLIASLLPALLVGRPASAAVQFTVKVTDSAGVGFNDTTPVSPVGGNTATTLGKQRLAVFQAAADAWGRVLESPVPIIVEASFAPLECTSTGAVAGQAAPLVVKNATGLPADVTYPVALANRILGKDVAPDQPDIKATFNGALKACLDVDWYYGLDGQSGQQSDLLSTVMHELAHGLGFSSGVNPSTGAWSQGVPSVFSSHVLDASSGKHWNEMTDAERKASILNVRNLVWDGERVKGVAAWFMAKGSPSLQVQPALSGFSGIVGEANFGPPVADVAPISGQLMAVAMTPVASGGCALSGNFRGKIGLVTGTSTCASIDAALDVGRTGGLAVLFSYNELAGSPPPMELAFNASDRARYPVSIPTLALTSDDAKLLLKASSSTVTLSADNKRLLGTDEQGHVMLYASNPIQVGSTGSHWDPLVRPDLLLEPATTPDQITDLDMERALLYDIGWTTICGNGTPDGQEECDKGVANSDTTPDGCRANCTLPKCGDGVIDSGEQCDPGLVGGILPSGADPGCSTDCKLLSGAGGKGGNGGGGGSGGSGGVPSTPTAGKSGGGTSGSAGKGGGGGAIGGAGGSSAGAAGQGSSSTGGGPLKSGGDGGCSCRVGSDQSSAGFIAVLLGLGLLRRRCRSASRAANAEKH